MQVNLTIDRHGAVTLPAKLLRSMDLKADDQLIAETTRQSLLLRRVATLPTEPYTPELVQEFGEAEAELAAVLPKLKIPR